MQLGDFFCIQLPTVKGGPLLQLFPAINQKKTKKLLFGYLDGGQGFQQTNKKRWQFSHDSYGRWLKRDNVGDEQNAHVRGLVKSVPSTLAGALGMNPPTF